MSAPSPTTALPSRTSTIASEDAIPDADPSTTAGLLAERLQAWKHMVAYLEEYIGAVEKVHGRQAKEYEKVLKTISNPLREGHHFDQSLGGVAGFFENVRANTQSIINTNIETEKGIKGSVLPILDRLHREIKHKAKELASGAQQGAKEVEKLRNITQKHIELLGQHTAAYGAHGGKVTSADDPYVLRRGVMHRLSNQVLAENNHRNDLIAVQANFHTFESHILEVVQSAMEAFVQLAGGQGEKMRALYADMLGTAQCIPRDFEWSNFSVRYADRLVNPNDPPRSVGAIAFPNMDHGATKALIEGSLERKSRNKLSFGYSTGYYVVTPSKFLHEFKDSDDVRQDPKPELSIYLPDAVVGAPSGEKFSIKGNDKSGTLSSKLTGSSELNFKAHTATDAQRWFQIIHDLTSAGSHAAVASPTAPAAAGAVTHDEKAAAAAATTTTEIPNPTGDHKEQEAGVTEGTSPEAAAVDAKPSADEKTPAP
ncbi:Cytoskeletal signaling protein slm1 [Escovopsis weberi]|uniref:Cytoskeletal signaling protein slm1 n=1 Tax=Escovopsis weberi TaxID=150374 RepID=A0A0M8MQN3_ESCWE|nr:Cytoskeletal signaling protein slm1 [Escovopsis weberi]